MTKAKRADLLLCAARHWQNDCSASVMIDDIGRWQDAIDEVMDLVPIQLYCWESACLSEDAAIGFDVESVEP